MNRAMATVARMNHFAERHSQRGDVVSVSPLVVIFLCSAGDVVTDSIDFDGGLTIWISWDESRREYAGLRPSTKPCRDNIFPKDLDFAIIFVGCSWTLSSLAGVFWRRTEILGCPCRGADADGRSAAGALHRTGLLYG